jgi:hypothetical protein
MVISPVEAAEPAAVTTTAPTRAAARHRLIA